MIIATLTSQCLNASLTETENLVPGFVPKLGGNNYREAELVNTVRPETHAHNCYC